MNPAPLIRLALDGHTSATDASASASHTSTGLVPMLAHQGGWDEAMLVGLPLVVIGLLLWVANRRVSAQLAAPASEEVEGQAVEGQAVAGAAGDASPSNDAPDAP